MGRPAWVQEVGFAPVGQVAAGGCDESARGQEDTTGGDGWRGHGCCLLIVGRECCSDVNCGIVGIVERMRD